MDREEFKAFVKKNDRLVGIMPKTKALAMDRRNQFIENVPQKVLDVVEYLIEKDVEFHVYELLTRPKKKKGKPRQVGLLTTIYIPKYRIAMRYVDDSREIDQSKATVFFKTYKKMMYPFFIRESETVEFLHEKVDNCIKLAEENPKTFVLPYLVPEKQKRERMKAMKVKY